MTTTSATLPTIFDSQLLKGAEKCLYYYKLKFIDGWASTQPSVHLEFGKHFATALERYYTLCKEGAPSNEALITVIYSTLVETWQNFPEGHNYKTRENLIRTIIWYVDQFEDEDVEIISLEQDFTLDTGDGIMLSGRLDRLVRYSGALYIMDQKSTGSTIGPTFFKQFDLDSQMSLYTFAGRAIFNLPIKGVIIDAAQIAVGFSRFERGFTFRTDTQLEEWYADALFYINLIQTAISNDSFPRNRSSCDKFGGCEFRDYCAKSPEVREAFLQADYKRRGVWDPITKSRRAISEAVE